MDKIIHLLLSFYIVVALIDLGYAYKKKVEYKLSTFEAPKRSFLSFFFESHKWTLLTCISLFFWYTVYNLFV